jgi:hypothetical protein
VEASYNHENYRNNSALPYGITPTRKKETKSKTQPEVLNVKDTREVEKSLTYRVCSVMFSLLLNSRGAEIKNKTFIL